MQNGFDSEEEYNECIYGGNSGIGSLPTITVTATKPDPFPSGIYYPWSGGSGGGNSGSGDREVIFPNSTQTECSTDTTANPIVIAMEKRSNKSRTF